MVMAQYRQSSSWMGMIRVKTIGLACRIRRQGGLACRS
ncbi:hypothetical protein DLM_2774 [Aquitalea magnusonii]|uniref:Uncharacterized protein n=1 Tax=Aquitalea magnusonii TaxID=332411 RepID=A0A3G9GFY8_9NEIS|nr:hypothetical protein DLM_2774 [Aquitalea magnusonii]